MLALLERASLIAIAVGQDGLEPSTPSLSGRCANQLRHWPKNRVAWQLKVFENQNKLLRRRKTEGPPTCEVHSPSTHSGRFILNL